MQQSVPPGDTLSFRSSFHSTCRWANFAFLARTEGTSGRGKRVWEGGGGRITEQNVRQKVERASVLERKEADRFKMPPTTGHTPLFRCLQRICLRARMRPQSFFGCFARYVAVYIRARNKRLLSCFRRHAAKSSHRLPDRV